MPQTLNPTSNILKSTFALQLKTFHTPCRILFSSQPLLEACRVQPQAAGDTRCIGTVDDCTQARHHGVHLHGKDRSLSCSALQGGWMTSRQSKGGGRFGGMKDDLACQSPHKVSHKMSKLTLAAGVADECVPTILTRILRTHVVGGQVCMMLRSINVVTRCGPEPHPK